MRLTQLLAVAAIASTIACGSYPARHVRSFVAHEYEESDVIGSPPPNELSAFGLHSRKGWTKLPARLAFEDGTPTEVRAGFARAGETWNAAAGFEVLRFEDETPAFVGPLYDRLDDDVTTVGVEYRWCRTGKSAQVLATTIWDNDPIDGSITDGDILVNGEFYRLEDSMALAGPDAPLADVESVALHELGHLIGLAHVPEATSIMNSTIYIGKGISHREVSQQDVERLRYLYVENAPLPGEAFETPNWGTSWPGWHAPIDVEPAPAPVSEPEPPVPARAPCDFPP